MIEAKKLFLIDAVGALVSATFLGLVLPQLQGYIGIPNNILFFFASLACLFSVFSFWHYFNFLPKFQTRLKFIALANFLYCILTIFLLIPLKGTISTLGTIYFVVEVLIILVLAALEFKKSYSKPLVEP